MTAKSKPAPPELRAIFKDALIAAGGRFQTARRINIQYGISQVEAIEIFKEISERTKAAEREERVKRCNQAKAYAAKHMVGWRKLHEMFGVTAHQARNIAKAATAGRNKRNEFSRINQDAARAYLVTNHRTSTVSAIAKRFKISTNTARVLINEATEAARPKPPIRRFSTVRRFVDLSGTDATTDRVRYPSGIGFGVVEVVR
jgi:hypothetical protein